MTALTASELLRSTSELNERGGLESPVLNIRVMSPFEIGNPGSRRRNFHCAVAAIFTCSRVGVRWRIVRRR
jgi:hypothetical protein